MKFRQVNVNVFGFLTLLCSMLVALPTAANMIEGTKAELLCVYNQRDALSFQGHIDPIPINAPGCVVQFNPENATDYTHGGVDLPKPVIAESPPAAEWPTFSTDELKRIGCHLEHWLKSHPESSDDAKISLDLSKQC
ncbi:hypothetical protein N9850_04135 [Granulosicoccus sp.]|nr:hypothetical protein [Granulosicoccus sp.]MDB4222938.1 hypothetical protein [Granulosicoccus sp.]